MLNKILLGGSVADEKPPEPGYVKSFLTLVETQVKNDPQKHNRYVGFSKGQKGVPDFGALNPPRGYKFLYAKYVGMNSGSAMIQCTKPFYVFEPASTKWIKCTHGAFNGDIRTIGFYFQFNIGNTIEVWLTKGK